MGEIITGKATDLSEKWLFNLHQPPPSPVSVTKGEEASGYSSGAEALCTHPPFSGGSGRRWKTGRFSCTL